MVKSIKILVFLSLFTMLLPSCKKLNSSTIFVSTFCEECSEVIRTSIEEIEGIRYVSIDTTAFSISYHYENRDVNKRVENWLNQNGLMPDSSSTDDSLFSAVNILDCCYPD
jgi:flavodoxin